MPADPAPRGVGGQRDSVYDVGGRRGGAARCRSLPARSGISAAPGGARTTDEERRRQLAHLMGADDHRPTTRDPAFAPPPCGAGESGDAVGAAGSSGRHDREPRDDRRL